MSARLVLVVPCYNEAARLRTDEIALVLARPDANVLLVDDGSVDGTGRLLEELAARHGERVRVLRLEKNSGKAEAVRRGVLAALEWRPEAEFVGFWDADFAAPAAEIARLLGAFSEPTRMAVGSRVYRLGARIDRIWWRHYLGRIFATLVSALTGLPAYDTQCGAKILRSGAAREAFRRPFVSRWFFDIELILRARQMPPGAAEPEAVVEVPLRAWREVGGSKLRARDVLLAPFELLRIRLGSGDKG